MKDLQKLLKSKHMHWGGPVIAGGLTWVLTGLAILGLIVGAAYYAYNTYTKGNSKPARKTTSRRKTSRKRK